MARWWAICEKGPEGAGAASCCASLRSDRGPRLAGAAVELGAVGAAVLWSLRVSVDAALLFAQAFRLFPVWQPFFTRIALGGLVGALITLWIAFDA